MIKLSDANRGLLLDAEFPQTVLHMLEGYLEAVPQTYTGVPMPLSLPDLDVVKTSIGALLNVSLGYGNILASDKPAVY